MDLVHVEKGACTDCKNLPSVYVVRTAYSKVLRDTMLQIYLADALSLQLSTRQMRRSNLWAAVGRATRSC